MMTRSALAAALLVCSLVHAVPLSSQEEAALNVFVETPVEVIPNDPAWASSLIGVSETKEDSTKGHGDDDKHKNDEHHNARALYPYVAAIAAVDSTLPEDAPLQARCGGALVSSNALLTSAHCLISSKTKEEIVPVKNLRVIVGRPSLAGIARTQKSVVRIQKYVVFPGFKEGADDLAVVFLDTCLKLQPIPISKSLDLDKPKSHVTVLSWGPSHCKNFDIHGSQFLKRTHLQVGSEQHDANCQPETDPAHQSPAILCLKSHRTSTKDINLCKRDAGGAVITTDAEGKLSLVGILSRGASDLPNSEIRTTRLSMYTSWFKELFHDNACTGEHESGATFHEGNNTVHTVTEKEKEKAEEAKKEALKAEQTKPPAVVFIPKTTAAPLPGHSTETAKPTAEKPHTADTETYRGGLWQDANATENGKPETIDPKYFTKKPDGTYPCRDGYSCPLVVGSCCRGGQMCCSYGCEDESPPKCKKNPYVNALLAAKKWALRDAAMTALHNSPKTIAGYNKIQDEIRKAKWEAKGGKLKRSQVLMFEKRLKAQVAIGTDKKKKAVKEAKQPEKKAPTPSNNEPTLPKAPPVAPKALKQCMPHGVTIPEFVKNIGKNIKEVKEVMAWKPCTSVETVCITSAQSSRVKPLLPILSNMGKDGQVLAKMVQDAPTCPEEVLETMSDTTV